MKKQFTIYIKEKLFSKLLDERNLVESTIKIHFAKAISQNLISIDEVMPESDVKRIAEYFPENLDEVRLSSIKELTSLPKLLIVI